MSLHEALGEFLCKHFCGDVVESNENAVLFFMTVLTLKNVRDVKNINCDILMFLIIVFILTVAYDFQTSYK